MPSIAACCRALLAVLATAGALGAPATAGAATVSSGGCPDVPVVHPFAPWGDSADYFLAPDGGFELGGTGWSLTGGARVSGGNEPFHVVARDDLRALTLPAGSSATSAPFCIGAEHRSMRFFARSAATGSLHVDVLYADAGGAPRMLQIGDLDGGRGWAPSDVVPMVVNELAARQGNAMTVQLRFSAAGPAAWAIDDVFVDPYRSR